jgi:hypothetical protein
MITREALAATGLDEEVYMEILNNYPKTFKKYKKALEKKYK